MVVAPDGDRTLISRWFTLSIRFREARLGQTYQALGCHPGLLGLSCRRLRGLILGGLLLQIMDARYLSKRHDLMSLVLAGFQHVDVCLLRLLSLQELLDQFLIRAIDHFERSVFNRAYRALQDATFHVKLASLEHLLDLFCSVSAGIRLLLLLC